MLLIFTFFAIYNRLNFITFKTYAFKNIYKYLKNEKNWGYKKYIQQFHYIPQFTYHPTTRPIKFCTFIIIIIIIIIDSCCEVVGKLNVKLPWIFFFFLVILDLHISKYVFNENPFVFRDLMSSWLAYFWYYSWIPLYYFN